MLSVAVVVLFLQLGVAASQPEPSWRKVYNRWNGGLPWDVARSRPLLPEEVAALAVVWALLLLAVIVGLRRITKPEGAERLPMLEQSA